MKTAVCQIDGGNAGCQIISAVLGLSGTPVLVENGCAVFHGLLPAAAESFVELHDGQQFIQTDLRQRQLSGEQIAIGI